MKTLQGEKAILAVQVSGDDNLEEGEVPKETLRYHAFLSSPNDSYYLTSYQNTDFYVPRYMQHEK